MRRLGMMAGAVVAAMMASSAGAQVTGYLMGDPAPGKLIPYFRATGDTATLIGIENTFRNSGPYIADGDVAVHVSVFNRDSVEITDFTLCLSPFDFGFIVLQDSSPTQADLDELKVRGRKARVLSVQDNDIVSEGYVTLGTVGEFFSNDGSCDPRFFDFTPTADTPLATWAILADIGDQSFATEIPTPTANVNIDPTSLEFGQATGGPGAYGLIPTGNRVIARFDVNPAVDSKTEIFVWLADPDGTRTAFLDCEDEFEQSTTIKLTREVNIIDPDDLKGINQCKLQGQHRGVLRFTMPDTGFVWSQITQLAASFRQNYLGYNLDPNTFLCTPGTIPPC